MTFKKLIKLILFNLGIAATSIVVFSKAFLYDSSATEKYNKMWNEIRH